MDARYATRGKTRNHNREHSRLSDDFVDRHEDSRLAKLEATYSDTMDRCRMTPHDAGRDAAYNVHYSLYGQRHPFLADYVGAYERGRAVSKTLTRNRHDDWDEARARARQNPKNRAKWQQNVVACALYFPMRLSGSLARTLMPIRLLGQQADQRPPEEDEIAAMHRRQDIGKFD